MAIYIKYSPAKMNNRQYYKAKEKGPEGPLGFPINLPKGDQNFMPNLS